MVELESKCSTSQPRITFIPKRFNVILPKISPMVIDQLQETKPNISSQSIPSPISPKEIVAEPLTPNIDDNNSSPIKASISTFDFKKLSTASITETPTSSFFNQRIKTKKFIVRVVIVVTILVICLAAAILPPVFILIPRQTSPNSSSSNLIVSACSSKTCIGSETPYRISTITALYPLDGNPNDLYGYYAGVIYGSTMPNYGQDTSYIRSAIEFEAFRKQYIRISPVNLRQQSFTIQLWYLVASAGSSVDYGLFSQCGSDLICFSLSVRNGRITLSFDSMNSSVNILTGGTVTSPSNWNHVTVVYDAVLYQQLIYLNGRIDAISRGITKPYQGTSFGADTYIGLSSSVNYSLSYFYGYIDHVTISAGVARTACQIYNDATLFAYYPFDTTDILIDRSVNMIHGIASNIKIISSGRLQQAISFEYNTSYFQAQIFPTIRPNNQPFSIALWVKPTVIVRGGSLVHISNYQNGTGNVCYDLLGFTTTGILVAQLITPYLNLSSIQGTTLSLNTWTHIAVIYTYTNGLRLFINGQLIASVVTAIYNNQFNNYITLGNNSPGLSLSSSICQSSSIVASSYRGAIDEFRVYNRELDVQELCVLANI